MSEQLTIAGIDSGYTKAHIVRDLAYVVGRIEWMAADRGDWSTRIAEYEACAAELRALLADPEYQP